MKKKTKVLLIVIASSVSLFSLAIIGLGTWIYLDVSKYKTLAYNTFPNENNNLDSMILFMNDSKQSFHDRNHMVWAIGRLADKRALPALLENYNGLPCKHNEYLCQYELAKAINRCGGNISL